MLPKTPEARLLLFASLAVGALCRVFVTFNDDGIYWPDEVYQSLEPAHRLVFGYGLVAWEFIDGARNWAMPGLVAFVMKACAVFGADHPRTYLHVIKLVFVAMSLGAGLGTYRLAIVSGASERAASIGAAAWLLCAPAIYFSPRAMSENASTVTAVWALALVLDPAVTRRLLIIGASLLGLSVLFRLQLGLFAVGALGILLARKERTRARDVFAVLCVWAFIYGALDAATWHQVPTAKFGGWFHSALVYLKFNLIEGKAAQWGTSPPEYYVAHLLGAMPLVTVALVLGLVSGARKATGVVVLSVVFLLVHSLIAHKELRFILPFLPVALAGAAVGLDVLPKDARMLGLGGLFIASCISAFGYRDLKWGDLGAYPERKDQSAWDDSGSVNRLMLAAHDQADLCGLRIDIHPAWHGGSSYLHRNVPLHWNTPPNSGFFNYAITGAGSGLPVIAKEGPMELVKLPQVTACVPEAQQGYSWRLP